MNFGIGLAREGKKVLLVDSDPQGSLTISLGNPQPDQLPVTLATVMGKELNEEPIDPGEGLLHHGEGVDLMPANIELSGMEVLLVNAMSREKVLKQYLDGVKRQYDYVFLDCMPSLGMLTVNALAAADSVLIPVQAQYLPAKGLEQLLQVSRLWDGDNMNQNELSFSNLTYLEAIYRLYGHTGCVHPVDLANDLQVSKPSVTRALRLLTEEGLIRKNSCGEILATQKGASIAKKLCKKCKTLRALFEKTIGLISKFSCREAIRLSYCMSDEIVHAIQTYLAQSVDSDVPAVMCK